MPVNKTLKQHILWDDEAVVIDTMASQGSWLVDKETKKTYLDCFSQFASQPLGWNHPKVLDKKDKLTSAAIHKIANSDMATEEFSEFTEAFADITPDFQYHFFIDGGALGVENALKAAFDWKAQKDGLSSDSMNIIFLREAFHGRTGYTMSMTNSPHSSLKVKWYPKFNWTKIQNPKMRFPVEETEIADSEKIALAEMEQALSRRNVAAIIYEPIQGEGGDNHFRKEFFLETRRLADEYDAMFILDEVQTGVGLTGKMWAYEHFDVIPDMICFGKKTQVCGFSCGRRIDEIDTNVFHVPSRINSTWGGNIVDMVRSKIFIDIIQEDQLIDNADRVGKYFVKKLRELGLDSVRGRGLMIAFDLENEKNRDSALKELSKNVLALACGSKSIRFRPHLTFTEEDVDTAVEFISQL